MSGARILTFSSIVVALGLGPAFACYTDNPERFTFLTTTEDNRLGLVTATPQ